MLNERKLTKAELNKREDIIKDMKKNKRALVKRYGKDAEKVMYGRATNIAKKQAESMNQDKLREMIKDSLQNPKKADLNKDGKLSDYEKKRGAAIEKSMMKEMSGDKMEALMDLRNILDELQVLGDQARDIIAQNFPSFLSKGEAYGVFNMGSSVNRYDTTLASIVADIEEYGDEEEDEDMMQEDLDLGHQDNEPHMLKADLYRIGKYAMELYQMVDGFEGKGEVDFPHWWQSKIIKSKDALVGAKHYLDFETKEPQIDAMVDVASKEEVINEPVNEGDLDAAIEKEMKANSGRFETPFPTRDLRQIRNTKDHNELSTSAKKVLARLKKKYKINEEEVIDEAAGKFVVRPCSNPGTPFAVWQTSKDGENDKRIKGFKTKEDAQKFADEKNSLKEEEAGEADKVASDIQKAMNAAKGDEAKTHQLKQARKAMNKGDLDKAKKIADRIAKMLKKGITPINEKKTTTQESYSDTAYKLGVKAFNRGSKRIPVLDKNLMGMLKGKEITDTSSNDIMDSWIKGWDTANLKAPVGESVNESKSKKNR